MSWENLYIIFEEYLLNIFIFMVIAIYGEREKRVGLGPRSNDSSCTKE